MLWPQPFSLGEVVKGTRYKVGSIPTLATDVLKIRLLEGGQKMSTVITMWKACDGTVWESFAAANSHEEKLKRNLVEVRRRESTAMTRLRDKAVIQELAELVNRNGLEADSNTPDFIIAEHLFSCLQSYNETTRNRDTWWGDNKALKPHVDEALDHAENAMREEFEKEARDDKPI